MLLRDIHCVILKNGAILIHVALSAKQQHSVRCTYGSFSYLKDSYLEEKAGCSFLTKLHSHNSEYKMSRQ